MKIVSGILIVVTAFLGLKHGWDGLRMKEKPGEVNMMTELGIGKTVTLVISILSIAGALMVLIPQTFFAGNLLNAMIIVFVMSMALRAGVVKVALIEIPFLLMPLAMIWLGHPFKK